jgi:hypothetical protein
MDAKTRKIYIACLETAKDDAENGYADLFEVDDMARLFDQIEEEGRDIQDVYIIGSNSIIDRVLESEGLIDKGEWL